MTDLPAVREISGPLNGVLADAFTLYLKTKNFHRHMSGPHFPRLSVHERARVMVSISDTRCDAGWAADSPGELNSSENLAMSRSPRSRVIRVE
jgi:hypothetical protein